MSFDEQERALFDLLFDRDLRHRFSRAPATALAGYALDAAERADFAAVRPDALEIDARMRADLILSQLCRAYPLTFCIASSVPGLLDAIGALIDPGMMRTAPVERAGAFGVRLRELLAQRRFIAGQEYSAALMIVTAEFGMVLTAAALKKAVLSGEPVMQVVDAIPGDWLDRPAALAPYVSVALVPRPYHELLSDLCPATGQGLWEHLRRDPLPTRQRAKSLGKHEPRLLLAGATTSHVSRCEVTVEHRTVELSEGFAPLIEHLDGNSSVRLLLEQFKQAGAPEPLVKSVQAGFLELLKEGMMLASAPRPGHQ